MLANLLHVAGVNHIVTIDLHASQMQGFFKCPVDNLHAEPLIARWIRHNVENWKEAVCVSKNAGGTKRVTSLADALKLNFGMVTTDRRRTNHMSSSLILNGHSRNKSSYSSSPREVNARSDDIAAATELATELATVAIDSSEVLTPATVSTTDSVRRSSTALHPSTQDDEEQDKYTDERARDIIHGRLVHGHIVPDDYPSPTTSAMSSSMILEKPEDDEIDMSASFYKTEEAGEMSALGGTADAAPSSDEEGDEPQRKQAEQMITLVGDVRGRTVFLVDDMIDKSGSWIAAAETVRKRGGASKVYCIATHGLFGGDSLDEMEASDSIDKIVVTNSFPIDEKKLRYSKKLVVLELAGLLSEAIRRNHYGESISALFQHASD